MSFNSTQNLNPTYNTLTCTDTIISTGASVLNLALASPIITTSTTQPTITDLGYYSISENGITENFVSGVESLLAETLVDNTIGVYQANIKTALTIDAGVTIDSFFLSFQTGDTTILQKPESIPVKYADASTTTTMMSICFFNPVVQPFSVVCCYH